MLRFPIAAVLGLLAAAGQSAHAVDYRAGESSIFGTYSKAYQDRWQLKKWQALCKGGGRYLAMSEAYEARKPDPCNPAAREWVR